MTKRMIDSAIWTNKKFGKMPMEARLLLVGIVTNADDQGRVDADPYVLRGQIFTFDEIPIAKIQEWLELLHASKTIILYTNGEGEQLAQLINWWTYQSLQYAQPSRFDKPDGWADRIRYNFSRGVILTYNWILADGTETPNTCDENGAPYAKPYKKTPEPDAEPPTQPENNEFNQVDNQVENHLDFQVGVQDKDKDQDQVVVVKVDESKPPGKATTTTTTAEKPASKPNPPIIVQEEADDEESPHVQFVREYERIWGMLVSSPYHMEKITDWADRVPLQIWSYALQQAADTRNTGKWNYLEAILARLEKEGADGIVSKSPPAQRPPAQQPVMRINLSMI